MARTAARSRRRARLRATAPPIRRLAVKPMPISDGTPRGPAWRTNAGVTQRQRVPATARNSRRRLRRTTRIAVAPHAPKPNL
jgi:hypothetical protein